MKKQRFDLPKYDWRVKVFYDTTPNDVGLIIDALEGLDCPLESIKRSYYNITEGGDNCGLTYSNVKMRETVMVIGRTSSLAQFLNTTTHEGVHLLRHIGEYYDIDPYSETAAYLAGDIAQKMHPCLQPFMCKCKGGCKH